MKIPQQVRNVHYGRGDRGGRGTPRHHRHHNKAYKNVQL